MTQFQSFIKPRAIIGLTLITLAITVTIATRSGVPSNIENWLVGKSEDAGMVLDQLDISGAEKTPRKAILAALDMESGMPLITVDLPTIRAKLEALPWVKEVSVARHYPGVLKIEITERQPFALTQLNGQLALIDITGTEITREGLSAYADLLLLVGPEAASAASEVSALKVIDPALSARVTSAVRVGTRRWDLIFDQGVRVKLPDNSKDYDMLAAFARFSSLETRDKILSRELSVIDMRYPDRVIMRVSPLGQRALTGRDEQT